ncbi:hypothetical protein SRHO_G00230600 [Serrasalmus rhombeus]
MSPLQRAAGPVWAGDSMCEGGLPLTFRDVRCPSLVRQRPPARHPDTPPALPSLSPYLQSQRGKENGLKFSVHSEPRVRPLPDQPVCVLGFILSLPVRSHTLACARTYGAQSTLPKYAGKQSRRPAHGVPATVLSSCCLCQAQRQAGLAKSGCHPPRTTWAALGLCLCTKYTAYLMSVLISGPNLLFHWDPR